MSDKAFTPEGFFSSLAFEADDYQRQAVELMTRNSAVLVAAPTGAGKTVVAEYACQDALAHNQRCFYATPLKALSNQKYNDFNSMWGRSGLLTGDNSIDGDAPIVVMTTEVLRNMIYAAPESLSNLRWVVLDEVHYLQDRYRGGVWEEIIVNLPQSVGLLCLSATISNSTEFTGWLATVRGSADVVVSTTRPVDLHPMALIGTKLYDVASEGRISPGFEQAWHRASADLPPGRLRRPDRIHVARILEERKMLPCIYFIFSRAGCDDAATMVGHRPFVTRESAAEIKRLVERRTAFLDPDEAQGIGYSRFLATVMSGIAPHHAGMVPLFREAVEELFSKGLIKLVFATETLSLGINMPAKSVVIENLMKFDGVRRELLTPLQFTQLTGRAGRRGIDVEGFGVALFDARVDPKTLAGLVTQAKYELTSSFSPSYNMVVNLLARHTSDQCIAILNSSFAQFASDRHIVGMGAKLRRLQTKISESDGVFCDLGDVAEYVSLIGSPRTEVAEIRDAVAKLVAGDVVYDSSLGRLLVVEPLRVLGKRASRMTAVTTERKVRRLSISDFDAPPVPVARLRITANGWRSQKVRRRIVQELEQIDRQQSRKKVSPRHRVIAERGEAKYHAVAKCPKVKQHVKAYRELLRQQEQCDALERRIAKSTDSLGAKFLALCEVLRSHGFLSHDGVGHEFEATRAGVGGDDAMVVDALTNKGHALKNVYNAGGVVALECLLRGVLLGASEAELAAFASLFCFDSGDAPTELPRGIDKMRMKRVVRVAEDVTDSEKAEGLVQSTNLVGVFSGAAADWVDGAELSEVLARWEIPPGDFVRSSKQVADFLEQLASVGTDQTSALRNAASAMRRGVVGYTSVTSP